MTNKYSELSDSEIEHLIAEAKNGRVIGHINRDVFISKICSRYEDALKLMIDNKISLSPTALSNTWDASSPIIYPRTVVGATKRNPCRAIAECFLLMKDAENNNG